MKIRLIAVGSKMPEWVSAGYEEYAKRLPREIALELIEIPLGKRGKSIALERALSRESDQILSCLTPHDRVVALEVKGRQWSTEALASELESWQMEGNNVALLVGGPDGLSEACRARADRQWSLSPLTLPHPLVRIILAEQIYRACSINRNHPYHRS